MEENCKRYRDLINLVCDFPFNCIHSDQSMYMIILHEIKRILKWRDEFYRIKRELLSNFYEIDRKDKFIRERYDARVMLADGFNVVNVENEKEEKEEEENEEEKEENEENEENEDEESDLESLYEEGEDVFIERQIKKCDEKLLKCIEYLSENYFEKELIKNGLKKNLLKD